MLDPSLLVAIWTAEAEAVSLRAWIGRYEDALVVSDFARGEFASALAMKARRRDLSSDSARTIFDGFSDWTVARGIEPVLPQDIAAATTMVLRIETSLRLPDAIHVATARRLACTLVSLDKRQVSAAHMLGIGALNPLAQDTGHP